MINSVVTRLQEEGFSSVRANCQGYHTPKEVKWDEEDEGVVPDVTGEYKGSLYVFDVQTGDEVDGEVARDRWRLLSVHARRYHGKFYLVVPEVESKHLEEIVDGLDIQPGILKVRGVDDA